MWKHTPRILRQSAVLARRPLGNPGRLLHTTRAPLEFFTEQAPSVYGTSLLDAKSRRKLTAPKQRPKWLERRQQRKRARAQVGQTPQQELDASLPKTRLADEPAPAESLPMWSDRTGAARPVAHPPAKSAFSHYAITLVRSKAGLDKQRREIVEQLGFTKTNQTVIKPITANVAGLVLRVKEVVKVANLRSPSEALASRRPSRGFTVVGRLGGGVSGETAYKRPVMVFSRGVRVPFSPTTGAMFTKRGPIRLLGRATD